MEWNYLDAYIEETGEQLSRLEQLLLELEEKPEQSDVLNEIFRIMHTLKGSSATMGFSEVADFSHNLESLFDKLRKGELGVNDELIDLFFECLDALKKMITAAIKGEVYDGNAAELVDIINNLIHTGSMGENTKWQVSVKINGDCMMKTARALVIVKYLEEMGNILSIDPPIDVLIREKLECKEIVAVIEISRDIEDIILGLKNIQDVENVEIRPVHEKVRNKVDMNDVKINLSMQYKVEDLQRLKEALMRADVVNLEFGENPNMSLALLQLILAAHRENKVIRCEKGGGPVVKMLKLMGVF
ncbi:Hpt domain-containing protein [Thermovorax subterraneus]|nr:Hpt domain-containing protein [Thermovorax subterraneus]